jgi:glycosyltransferase involved in cell wall biosynthesis
MGASSRLRAYQYLPYLKQQGIEVTSAPLFPPSYQDDLYFGRPTRWLQVTHAYLKRLQNVLKSSAYNLIWIEYELFPWLPSFAERALAFARIPFVVDYDDAIFHRYDSHRRGLVRLLLGRKIDRIMRSATVVIAANQYIIDRAASSGARHIEYLPTVVDLRRYPMKTPTDKGPFTVGWVGSPSTASYLTTLEPVLRDFCEGHDARMVAIGARNIALTGFPLELRRWSEQSEVQDILQFDVGIMPVPDQPFERGKSGYKLIQYMACGLPVIASPIGINAKIVQHGVNGFVASNNFEWRRALDSLYDSPPLRKSLGQVGRTLVEAEYNTEVTAPRLATVLRSAAGAAGAS